MLGNPSNANVTMCLILWRDFRPVRRLLLSGPRHCRAEPGEGHHGPAGAAHHDNSFHSTGDHYRASEWRLFACNFLSRRHVKRKIITFFLYWRNFESETCLQRYWFETLSYLTWPWPSLCQKSVRMTSWGKMTTNIDVYVQKYPKSICRTTCSWLLFYTDLWPDLDVFSKTFVIMQNHS